MNYETQCPNCNTKLQIAVPMKPTGTKKKTSSGPFGFTHFALFISSFQNWNLTSKRKNKTC